MSDKKRTFLINAITIREGGGAVVFFRTLNEMVLLDSSIYWIVIIDEVLRNKIKKHERVTLISYPWVKKSAFHLLYWNEFYLHRLVKNKKVDCVFSTVNTLPFRKMPCPTFLSQLHAGYFSKEFIALNAKCNPGFRNWIGWEVRKQWVFSSIKKATQISAPTQALADDIVNQLKINLDKITVIHPGTGLADGKIAPRTHWAKNAWRIGYITKYGVQKNFEVLFKAVSELKKQVNIKLILTLNTQHASFQHIDVLIKKYHLDNVIENHGEIEKDQIQALYSTLNLFVFPSLCESIGFTLMEAMHYGLPIIAANTRSNREFLGDNGVYFYRHDSSALKDKIILVMNEIELYKELSHNSVIRAQLFSWKTAAEQTLQSLRELTCSIN